MAKLTITLERGEKEALFELARTEHRDPRMQAALFIRSGLESHGMLAADKEPLPAGEAVGEKS